MAATAATHVAHAAVPTVFSDAIQAFAETGSPALHYIQTDLVSSHAEIIQPLPYKTHLQVWQQSNGNDLQQSLYCEDPREDHIAVAHEGLPAVIHVGMGQCEKDNIGNDDQHDEELTVL